MLRGDVYSVNLPRSQGRVQQGRRYAVVVQANELGTLSTVVVCPTSQSAAPVSFRPQVEVGESRTQVLCEMVMALDVRTLGNQVAHLSLDDLAAVDDALKMVLRLGR